MSKQVIVHMIPKFVFGGAERLVALYGALHDTDVYDVHIVACVEDGPLRADIENSGATVFAASRSVYGGRWGSWRALKSYLDAIEPDVVHTHLLTSDVIGWWYRCIAKKKPIWISTQHNVEDSRPWLYKRIWRYILPTADRVVAVAPRVFDFAHTVFRVPAARLQIVLNGIPLETWLPAAAHTPCTREEKVLHIGTIGRLEAQKGHIYALRALAQLPPQIDWVYHVYGEGSLRSSLEAEAKQLHIAERIVWHGVVSDMQSRIQNIDIVLQPSLFEGLSLVILESMAAGRVVVTTPAGGEGVITSGTHGYIVATEDVNSIVDALVYIAEHPEQATRVGEAASELARDSFSIEQHVRSLEAVYTQCLK